MGTAQRDVGSGRERGKVSTFPSFPPYFISSSLPSRRTPLSKRLEQAMIIITNMIMITIMIIYIIVILCDNDDEGDDDDDDKYLFSLESLIFLYLTETLDSI